jgi:hypothetical protein
MFRRFEIRSFVKNRKEFVPIRERASLFQAAPD